VCEGARVYMHLCAGVVYVCVCDREKRCLNYEGMWVEDSKLHKGQRVYPHMGWLRLVGSFEL